jgi:hypothetical protein
MQKVEATARVLEGMDWPRQKSIRAYHLPIIDKLDSGY